MNTDTERSNALADIQNNEATIHSQPQFDKNPAALHIAKQGSKDGRRVVESRLNRAARALMKDSWQDVDWSKVDRAWLYMIRELMEMDGRTPGSINGIFSAIRSVAKQAWELRQIGHEQYLRIKETENVKGSRTPNRTWVTKEQISALLQASMSDNRIHGVRNTAMVALTFMAGLRRAETVSIDIKDIDIERQSIRIIGKGNKERIIYPPEQAWEMLSAWINEYRGDQEGPLFVRIRRNGNMTNKGLTTQTVMDILKALCMEAGIEGVTPHDLRASFISYMLETHDISTVAAIVGHSDIKTTQIYDRRGENAKENAMRGFSI